MNKLFILFAVILLGAEASAQEHPRFVCKRPESFSVKAKTTLAVPEENDYDIHHVKIDLSMNNQSAAFSGMARIDARVVAASMPVFAFELHDTLVIDSFKLNGQLLLVQSGGGTAPVVSNVSRKVFLSTPLTHNTLFSAEVYYRTPSDPFTPPASFNNRGMRNLPFAFGNKITFTSCEPYYSSLWWPCKQSLTDKIDSLDVWITVPDSLKAGSQGLLKNITNIAPGYHRYEWKSTYPIAYYLVSVAVGNYIEHSYTMHFTGSSDSMLIQNYLYANKPNAYLNQIDSVGDMINYFSSLLGRYPFWKEKYGHCWAPGGGAMENQTMTTTDDAFGGPPIPHELAHQWFGDNVTCGTWKDIWLNEGLATYLDAIYWRDYRGSPYYWYEPVNNDTLYITDTAYAHPPNIAYTKGAFVMRMLRYIAPSDSVFFSALKAYQATYAGSTATTADFQLIFENAYARPLDTFFNQWVFLKGYPTYQIRYAQSATQTVIRVIQTSSLPAVVPYFVMPLQIRFRSAQGDTLVTVYNSGNNETYTFNWSKPLFGSEPFVIDPDTFVINKKLASIKDTSLLGIAQLISREPLIYPNPTSNTWTVCNLEAGSSLSLTDMRGVVIWQSKAEKDKIHITRPDKGAGIYLLEVTNIKVTTVYKLQAY